MVAGNGRPNPHADRSNYGVPPYTVTKQNKNTQSTANDKMPDAYLDSTTDAENLFNDSSISKVAIQVHA